MRQHEAQRPYIVRRQVQKHFAFGQRLAHEPELAMLQIAQSTVDQLGRGRRGAGGKIVLLDQQHAQAPTGGIAGNAGTVNATANDREIKVRHAAFTPPPGVT